MDQKDKVGSPDRNRINVNEDYELQYWAETLGVTKEQLRNAVKEVGTSAEAVKRYFGK
jgi:hypothetical protein